MKKALFVLSFLPFLCFADWTIGPIHNKLINHDYQGCFEDYTIFLSLQDDTRSKSAIVEILHARMGRCIAAYHLGNLEVAQHDIDEFSRMTSYDDIDKETQKKINEIYANPLFAEMFEICEILLLMDQKSN